MKKYLALLLSIMMMFQTVLPLNTTWAAAETATATDVAPAVTDGEAAKPTETPTVEPTAEPTSEPTVELTEEPTAEPTEKPVEETETPPTEAPAEDTAAATDTEPVTTPTAEPTEKPTTEPTVVPETKPTENPTEVPTEVPTAEPTEAPTAVPTAVPTKVPTAAPTATPAPAPLQVALNADATFTYAHTQVNFNLTIAGGVAPFVIDWKVTGNGSQQDQGQATDVNEASYYIAYTPSTFGNYTVQATVTDANGTQTTVSAELIAAEHEGETEATWRESVASVTREYDWRTDLVAIAQTQVGYAQSEKDFVVDANGDRHAYSRYGAWYGDEYADDWSAMFIAFCMKYAGIPEEDFPRDDSIKVIKKDLNAKGVLETSDEYEPSRGDVVFFKSGDAKIGIVSKVADAKMDVIYASADGKVKKDEWEIRSRQIDCFANMEKLMIRAGKLEPTAAPTAEATPEATEAVTAEPTVEVTAVPTAEVTPEATEAVTAEPTAEVTTAPTAEVTPEATEAVTAEPTVEVTTAPTAEATPEATEAVTAEPTVEVTTAPTAKATPEATETVTAEPTVEVTTAPTAEVTPEATEAVTAEPAAEQTDAPATETVLVEHATPSDLDEKPTVEPTVEPTAEPTTVVMATTSDLVAEENVATASDLVVTNKVFLTSGIMMRPNVMLGSRSMVMLLGEGEIAPIVDPGQYAQAKFTVKEFTYIKDNNKIDLMDPSLEGPIDVSKDGTLDIQLDFSVEKKCIRLLE